MKKNINPLVCVFDSGIGGLGVLYECVRRLPRVDFAYFADNYNMPYGRFGREELIKISNEKFTQIASYNPAAAVVACNTVTAECAEVLRRKYSFPIIGVEPALKPAAEICNKALVLATRATLSSRKFAVLAEKLAGDCDFTFFCPSALAGAIEKNIFNLTRLDLKEHLPEGDFDGVVLGCTHYIFLREEISGRLNCPAFDGNCGTAARLVKILNESVAFSGRKNADSRKLIAMEEINKCSKNVGNITENGRKYGKNSIFFVGDSAFKNKQVFNFYL